MNTNEQSKMIRITLPTESFMLSEEDLAKPFIVALTSARELRSSYNYTKSAYDYQLSKTKGEIIVQGQFVPEPPSPPDDVEPVPEAPAPEAHVPTKAHVSVEEPIPPLAPVESYPDDDIPF